MSCLAKSTNKVLTELRNQRPRHKLGSKTKHITIKLSEESKSPLKTGQVPAPSAAHEVFHKRNTLGSLFRQHNAKLW